jgi:carbonic anhydrase
MVKAVFSYWIRHIKDVYRLHEQEFKSIADPQARFDRLVELNVMEQVLDLSKTSIIQNAWKTRQLPYIHGWVYNVRDGIIRDLNVSMGYNS